MKIQLNNIQVRANHGCWEEEEVIGGDFRVDVWLEGNFEVSAESDNLEKTIDYVAVKEIVYAEMNVRAKLIETVLVRMHSAMKVSFPNAHSVGIRLTKINAPMGHQVESVSVEMEG
jgi:dihydroneopterin aldolase